ncbi:hemolysin secretion protein D [Aureimonas endophytica]|uniref:Hemolysin secretion protein D n=1 Tax=Aureimonas endophytica TaxID=2027858 RepID=A0A916ZFL4_9HYPH|nr:efflux RND transporter periplasmic adaptor subunit [Aureimonas endophytica]GGD94102.1 hemolysin secretion protein D [Aureimonas endophytica]
MTRLFPICGLALVLAGCQGEAPKAEAPVVRPVKSTVVKPFADEAPVFAGTVESQVRTDYSFQILGRMVSRDVDIGDAVTKGQMLASLEATVLQQSVDAAEASVASAKATLANATGVAERQRALRQSNTATQADVDNAEQALEAARSAEIQAEAALAKAREQLGYARLTAGFDGIVTAVAAEAGQVVAAGQTVLTVARPDLRDAVVDLPDWMASTLSTGMPLPVALQLDAAATAEGRVREIAPLADPVTRSRRVRIALKAPPPGFRLGSIVTVALPGGEASSLALPDSAVLRRNGATMVWVVAPTGDRVATRPVSLEAAADGRWLVRDGLKEGERVVTAGVNSLTEGQSVKLQEGVR